MRTRVAVANKLIDRWVEPSPHKPGPAEAWVLPGCVSIWVVICQLEIEAGKAEVVAEDYELPLEAVQAAIAYYQSHKKAVDRRIARNRAFFTTLSR
jgi:hypothetical protein